MTFFNGCTAQNTAAIDILRACQVQKDLRVSYLLLKNNKITTD